MTMQHPPSATAHDPGRERRDRLLTAGWNNTLSIALAAPIAVVVGLALFTSVLSDRAAFAWLAIIGVVY